MKRLLPLRLALASVITIAALGGMQSSVHASRPVAAPVTITVWTAYTKGLLTAFNGLITSFEKQNPNVKVTTVSATDYNALFQKEQSAIFAGNPPTLGQAYEAWGQQFISKNNALQDLTPYIKGMNGLSAADLKDYFTGVWNDSMLNGKPYMMPFSKSDIVLYYNPALLAKYGITSPPKTWDQFAADCKKVTVISNGRASQWGSTLQIDEADWYAWELEWGNQVLDAHNKAAFGNAKGAIPVSFFANLAKSKAMVVSTTQNYQDQADFDAGKTAFDISTSAGLSYEVAGAQKGVQVAMAPFPAGPVRPVTEMFGAPLVMFNKATAAQKQAGWDFMKFITEPAQTAQWSMATGYVPVRRSALKLPVLAAYYKKYPDRTSAADQLDNAVVEPSLVGWPKAQNDISSELLSALTGAKDPLAAMRQAASLVNSDLATAGG
ncbi:MAG TPA: ABC transporter substrate-binding protein [Chloroflexota bacterium]|nr:ABC transporter substrate-binding protein [Chloroflexota bacterium]